MVGRIVQDRGQVWMEGTSVGQREWEWVWDGGYGHRTEGTDRVGLRAWCRMEGMGIGPRKLLWVAGEWIWD